jgi:hypothetical protein
MQAKLTLSIDKSVIERAKQYAHRPRHSLSGMVENYLREVTRVEFDNEEVTPVVAELSGVLPADAVTAHCDDYSDYLADKYR